MTFGSEQIENKTMGRTHDVTISAFDLDRLEGELEGTKEELADAKATADFWMKKVTEADKAADDLNSALRDANRHWKEETEEQARLLGMSAERECDLRGKLERERALADRLAEVLDYYYSEDSRHHIASNRAYARAAWSALASWKEARND
jgi:hypothetical protein